MSRASSMGQVQKVSRAGSPGALQGAKLRKQAPHLQSDLSSASDMGHLDWKCELLPWTGQFPGLLVSWSQRMKPWTQDGIAKVDIY